jgi:flagellar motor switch protein FliG
MAEAGGDLGSVERAAVLLLSIGEQNAAQILKLMDPKEVQRLGSAMATLKDISQEQVRSAVQHFMDSVGTQTALGVDSSAYVRSALTQALGEEKAGSLIDGVLFGDSAQNLETLKWMDDRIVANLVRGEHPQVAAIVLAYLDSDQSASILAQLPDELRVDVLMRIATLDSVQPAALLELNEALERQVSGSGTMQSSTSVGGPKSAAAILNHLTGEIETQIVEQLNELDPELGQSISDMMFVFEDLAQLDDAGTQLLLREVESDKMLLALKGADESLKEKFFGNMSKRAAEMLREDLEAKGPVRLSEVEAAQKDIIAAAQRLASEGQIVMQGDGDDEFV